MTQTLNISSRILHFVIVLDNTSFNGIIGTHKGCIKNGGSFQKGVWPFFTITLYVKLRDIGHMPV